MKLTEQEEKCPKCKKKMIIDIDIKTHTLFNCKNCGIIVLKHFKSYKPEKNIKAIWNLGNIPEEKFSELIYYLMLRTKILSGKKRT